MAPNDRNARARPPRRTNLRTPTSSFVGRRTELEALAETFEHARLVTLVGPGGIGKTRLALRHAETRLDSLAKAGRGGVWMIDLAEARTSAEALALAASVLELSLVGHAPTPAGERAMSEAIGRAIGRMGPVLLVIDNVEQIAVAAARHLNTWLELAPSARLLVTSRVVLGVPAERVLVLGPLAERDARALFVDRAASIRAVAPSESDPTLVGEIVDAIDRMPLAIELAASRTRVLSTTELRDRLERPLEVLAGGVTNDRHVSIRGAVLDSLALLDPPLRRAFALLSTLDNDFTLASAEAVLGHSAPGLSTRAPTVDVLAQLDALVRHSLVRVELEAGRPARYALFETIREVAVELARDEPMRDAALAAHASHHADLARRAHASDDERDDVLPRDLEHFLTARSIALGLGRHDDVVVLTLAVEPVLAARGLSALRATLLGEALTLAHEASRSLRAELHLARGLARRELGEGDAANEDFEAALALTDRAFTDHGADAGLRALALLRLGGIADLRGDTAGATVRFAEALALLARTPADTRRETREAEALLKLGHARRREGALDEAHAAFVRAVAGHRALRRDDGLAASLYELGVVEMFRERFDAAFVCLDEGLAVARRSGARIMEGACLTARGCLLQDLGRLGEALEHHAEAASLFAAHASRYREASALYYLATTYLERGDATEAHAVIGRARQRIEGVGAPRYDVLMSGGSALALAALGRHDEADRELDRASTALASVPREPSLLASLHAHRLTLAHRRGAKASDEAVSTVEASVRGSPSDDTRFAWRELERALGRATTEAHDALCVWGAGEAFLTPGGVKVQLPERSPMRRILDHLVLRRESSPGESVAIETLIEAGWPGEKMGTDAALNRAYVALSSLRKKGLRDAIVSVGGGYAISQAVVVRRMRAS